MAFKRVKNNGIDKTKRLALLENPINVQGNPKDILQGKCTTVSVVIAFQRFSQFKRDCTPILTTLLHPTTASHLEGKCYHLRPLDVLPSLQHITRIEVAFGPIAVLGFDMQPKLGFNMQPKANFAPI